MTPELISAAAVAALSIAEKAGVTELGKKTVGDAYDQLKKLIHFKFGEDSKPAQALAAVEADASSEGQKIVLAEQMAKINAAGDPALAAAAQTLIDLVQSLRSGERHVQTATGDGNFQNSGSNFSGQVHMGWRPNDG